jgi:membrane protease YdiL (CAAX protease family)
MTLALNPNNRLFELARQGQRQPCALVAVAVAFLTLVVAIVTGQMLGRFAIGFIFPTAGSVVNPLSDGARDLLTFTTGFLPIYLCLWAWVRLWSKRSFTTLGFEARYPVARAVGGATVAVVMMSAVAVGLALLPDTALAPGQLRFVGLAALGGGLLTLLGTAVQSSGEELLFRGWLLPTIGARYGPWIGVAVSSLLFGLAHGLNPNATALGLLNLSLFAIFLALYALAEGGLWGACAWHTLWNWTDSVVFGLPDSGGPIRPALLVSVTPSGRDIFAGGRFGPDGSLIETAVLLIGIGVIVCRSRAPHKPNGEVSVPSPGES